MASTVLPNGIIIPEKYSRDWYNDLYHNWQELDNLLGGGTPKDGTLTIQKNGTTVGTFSANQATDETVNIEVPAVNDATLTIQQNGTNVATFSANASTNATANIEVPTKTSDLNNDSGYITGIAWNDVADKPSFATVATSGSYNDLSNKPTIPTVNNGTLTIQQNGTNVATFTSNSNTDVTANISVPTKTSDLTNDSCVPLSGTNALAGSIVPDTDNAYKLGDSTYGFDKIYIKYVQGGYTGKELSLFSSANAYAPWDCGAWISLYANDYSDDSTRAGTFSIHAQGSGNNTHSLGGTPSGTLTWDGQPIQYVSDQRLKQQITEINDKLLDAWEDVNLVQFKYNDAVKEKSDNARLHTGYVVQQIDSACKSHGVDVSAYGLYCHEEYPEETEEVEVEQKDGTKVKEKKVIREASEHYSLRYTEVYAVECMYLRRCIKQLTARIEELEKGNNTK